MGCYKFPQLSSVYDDLECILEMYTIVGCMILTLVKVAISAFVCTYLRYCCLWILDLCFFEIYRSDICEDLVLNTARGVYLVKQPIGHFPLRRGFAFLLLLLKWFLGGFSLRILLVRLVEAVSVHICFIRNVSLYYPWEFVQRTGFVHPNNLLERGKLLIYPHKFN